jgi:hypothetical protein
MDAMDVVDEDEAYWEEEDAFWGQLGASDHIEHDSKKLGAFFRQRWDFERLIPLAIGENSFKDEFRVSPAVFKVLCKYLEPGLEKNQAMANLAMSKSKSGEITVPMRVGAALIFLGGGRHVEVMRTMGIAKTTAYKILHEFVKAVNKCPELAIEPFDATSHAVLQTTAAGFEARSTHGLFEHCVGAIDGLFIRIDAPTKKESPNGRGFYSGNKKGFGVNVQAVCDANCKVIAFCCKHSGSTNDCQAFETSGLKALNRLLPFPYHWNGDAAYTLTESMMIPYPGVNLHETDPDKEWFNFWHSQIRITIERTFGIFIQRSAY